MLSVHLENGKAKNLGIKSHTRNQLKKLKDQPHGDAVTAAVYGGKLEILASADMYTGISSREDDHLDCCQRRVSFRLPWAG